VTVSDLDAPNAPCRPALPRRRDVATLAAAALLLAVAPLATACGAGFTAASLTVRPNAGAGVTGGLKVNNVWLVVDPVAGQAQVIGAVANSGTTLDRVTGASASGVPARVTGTVASRAPACVGTTVAAGAVAVPVNRSVSFGQAGCPRLALAAAAPFRPGRITPVTLTFARAPSLTLNAQVVSATGLFAQYRLPRVIIVVSVPNATGRASASATASPSRTTSPGASASASASPSASPSPSR
jgi:hypothetical protein